MQLKDEPSKLPLILVTGGFRSRSGMRHAIEDGATDLIGLGRPTCIDPQLPNRLLDGSLSDEDASCKIYSVKGISWLQKLAPIQLIGTGFDTGK